MVRRFQAYHTLANAKQPRPTTVGKRADLWHLSGMSAAPAPLVSVIVVNWNGQAHLGRCLAALAAQTFHDFEVIVVDNGSSDGSAEIVGARWPHYRLLRQDRNLGFAAANNIGARAARGAWLALLNNDAFPEPDWLEKLARATEEHPQYSGFASCQLSDADPRLAGRARCLPHSGLARLGQDEPFGPPWTRRARCSRRRGGGALPAC